MYEAFTTFRHATLARGLHKERNVSSLRCVSVSMSVSTNQRLNTAGEADGRDSRGQGGKGPKTYLNV